MKGFKDTTRVQYFKGGAVTREKACGGVVKKAEGGRVTDPVKNKTGGKNDPEYGDYAISKVEKSAKPSRAPESKIVKNAKSGMSYRMVKAGKDWVRDPAEMKVAKDISDRDRKDIDKLGVSFNGVKVYPGDKAPSKMDKMAGAEAVQRQNRLGVANRGFDSETGTGLKKPLKRDDGRPLARAEGGKVDMKQDKKTVAAGVHKHERNMHPGKPLTKMQRGGFPSHSKAPLIKAR